MIDLDRAGGGGIALRLDASEADLLRGLVREMRVVLEARAEDDAVTRRLFPDAYDSAQESQAYRDLVGDDLAQTKLRALDRVEADLHGEGGATVALGGGGIDAWLATITDMRLAIGTRLDVDEDKMSRAPDPAEPEFAAMSVLHWLGWLQEAMLQEETG